jgi:hypothetical protein
MMGKIMPIMIIFWLLKAGSTKFEVTLGGGASATVRSVEFIVKTLTAPVSVVVVSTNCGRRLHADLLDVIVGLNVNLVGELLCLAFERC